MKFQFKDQQGPKCKNMTITVLLFVFIAVCQVITTLIPIIGKTSIENSEIFKTTNWGKSIIVFSLISLGLSIIFFLYTKDEEDRSKRELITKLDDRDSIHHLREDSLSVQFRKQIDSSYSKSIKASNEALAKYNIILIDSLNTVASTINIKSSKAQLSVASVINEKSPIYLTDDDKINIRIVSSEGTSYNINFNVYLCLWDKVNGLLVLQHIIDNNPDEFLIPGPIRTLSYFVEKKVFEYEDVFIIILGKFTRDEKGVDTKSFGQTFTFNFKQRKYGTRISGFLYENLIKGLKEKGLYK